MHPPHSRSPLISPWALVLLLPPLLYVLTMPVGYVIGDPWDELTAALSSAHLFRPYHLLTTVLYRGVLAACAWLPGGAIIHLEIFMILCAAAALVCVFILTGGSVEGALAVLLCGVSSAFWLHGSTIETGMPSLAALTGAVLSAMAWRERMISHRVHTAYFGMEGLRHISSLLFVLAVLLHAQVIVLLPAVLVLLAPERNASGFLRNLAAPVLVVGLLLSGAYLSIGIGVLGLTDPESLWSWLSTHHNAQALADISFSPLAIPRSLSGLLRLFVDIGCAGTTVRAWLTGSNMTSFGLPMLFRLAAAACTVLIFGRWMWRGRRTDFRLTLSSGAAVAGLMLFNSFWLGSDPQFWLSLLPFLLPLAVHGMRASPNPRMEYALAGLVIAVLFAANLKAREPSLVFREGDAAHQHASMFRTRYEGAMVLTPGSRWASALHSMHADVQVLQIFRMRSERDVLHDLDCRVENALYHKRTVFVAGLRNPSSEEMVMWESIRSQFGISRAQVLAHLRAHYQMVGDTLRAKEGISLALLRLRSASVNPGSQSADSYMPPDPP